MTEQRDESNVPTITGCKLTGNPGRWWCLELPPPGPDTKPLRIELKVQSLGGVRLQLDGPTGLHSLELSRYEAQRLALALGDVTGNRLEPIGL